MGEARVLSAVEIMRALRRYQFDLRDQYRVPMSALAAVCNLSRFVVHWARFGIMSDRTQVWLSDAIQKIERGELVFFRVGLQWEIDWLTPPRSLPGPQPKLLYDEDWNRWAQCATCGTCGWQFKPLLIASRVYRACGQCIPPDQWPAIGGRPVVTEAARRREAYKVAHPSPGLSYRERRRRRRRYPVLDDPDAGQRGAKAVPSLDRDGISPNLDHVGAVEFPCQPAVSQPRRSRGPQPSASA
jgi:hypothetical protein